MTQIHAKIYILLLQFSLNLVKARIIYDDDVLTDSQRFLGSYQNNTYNSNESQLSAL